MSILMSDHSRLFSFRFAWPVAGLAFGGSLALGGLDVLIFSGRKRGGAEHLRGPSKTDWIRQAPPFASSEGSAAKRPMAWLGDSTPSPHSKMRKPGRRYERSQTVS